MYNLLYCMILPDYCWIQKIIIKIKKYILCRNANDIKTVHSSSLGYKTLSTTYITNNLIIEWKPGDWTKTKANGIFSSSVPVVMS